MSQAKFPPLISVGNQRLQVEAPGRGIQITIHITTFLQILMVMKYQLMSVDPK